MLQETVKEEINIRDRLFSTSGSLRNISIHSDSLSKQQNTKLLAPQENNTPYCSCKFGCCSYCYYCCCCINNEAMKFHFFHSAPASFNNTYFETDKTYCLCLDCCSWCLEFRSKKTCLCGERTICFAGCCLFIFE